MRSPHSEGRNGTLVGFLPFPESWTVGMASNNAAAVLMPDNVTLVQFQPLVRCAAGGPVFSLSWQYFIPNGGSACADNPAFSGNTSGLTGNWSVGANGADYTANASILGEGTWGAHGGSRLSSIGGTIRLGELLPDAPPIPHAIKIMLWGTSVMRVCRCTRVVVVVWVGGCHQLAEYGFPAHDNIPSCISPDRLHRTHNHKGAAYFWPGNSSTVEPCYRWPALNCDCWSVPSVRPGNLPANANYYGGQ